MCQEKGNPLWIFEAKNKLEVQRFLVSNLVEIFKLEFLICIDLKLAESNTTIIQSRPFVTLNKHTVCIYQAHSFIHSFYFAINQKYNNSIQKYIKDNIQYSN